MRGVWTALVTPFNRKNEIDLTAYKKILQDQVSAGITGVVVCGTTGETPTLTEGEKKTLITTTLEELKGTPVQVIVGTGTNNTEETVRFSQWAAEQGVAGVLVVAPYYNKPSQAGLEAHYLKVADSVPCEVIIYHHPGRTGVSLTPETIVKLASHPRIRSLKEASGSVAFTSEILDALALHGKSLDIVSGDDAIYLPLLSVGAVGVISVASNLLPRAMVAIQKAMENGQHVEAMNLHRRYYPLFRDLFVETNPVPTKFAMAHVGWCEPHVRLPLVPLASSSIEKLKTSLKRCDISQGSLA